MRALKKSMLVSKHKTKVVFNFIILRLLKLRVAFSSFFSATQRDCHPRASWGKEIFYPSWLGVFARFRARSASSRHRKLRAPRSISHLTSHFTLHSSVSSRSRSARTLSAENPHCVCDLNRFPVFPAIVYLLQLFHLCSPAVHV